MNDDQIKSLLSRDSHGQTEQARTWHKIEAEIEQGRSRLLTAKLMNPFAMSAVACALVVVVFGAQLQYQKVNTEHEIASFIFEDLEEQDVLYSWLD